MCPIGNGRHGLLSYACQNEHFAISRDHAVDIRRNVGVEGESNLNWEASTQADGIHHTYWCDYGFWWADSKRWLQQPQSKTSFCVSKCGTRVTALDSTRVPHRLFQGPQCFTGLRHLASLHQMRQAALIPRHLLSHSMLVSWLLSSSPPPTHLRIWAKLYDKSCCLNDVRNKLLLLF